MKHDCVHRTSAGEPTVVFVDHQLRMVYPPRRYGVCRECGKTFELTDPDYENYMNGGEIE